MYKHQWHVAEAVAQLWANGLPVLLELAGPAYPPALARLKTTLARVDPAAECVRYLGSVPHGELHTRYAGADLCVFASSCENMPNILLEGMASGLPIACSNRGPMPEVLGDAGVYFDPENPNDIARALRELIGSPILRTRLAHASSERAALFLAALRRRDLPFFSGNRPLLYRNHKGFLTCAALPLFVVFDLEFLVQANRRQAHRGPDGQGSGLTRWSGVGLAHRRLSILDLSPTGAQPMASDDGAVALVFNGEIYNFRLLREELEATGHQFSRHFGHRGTARSLSCPWRADARAVEWHLRLRSVGSARPVDAPGSRWLGGQAAVLGANRGRPGVRQRDQGLVAGTRYGAGYRPRRPAPLPDLPLVPCPTHVTVWRQETGTWPRHAGARGAIESQWRFYELPFRQPITPMSQRQATEQVRETVRLAVSRQMVADVPVGAFLSGGLDSSAVAAFAQKGSARNAAAMLYHRH